MHHLLPFRCKAPPPRTSDIEVKCRLSALTSSRTPHGTRGRAGFSFLSSLEVARALFHFVLIGSDAQAVPLFLKEQQTNKTTAKKLVTEHVPDTKLVLNEHRCRFNLRRAMLLTYISARKRIR